MRGALHALAARSDVRAEIYGVRDARTDEDAADWAPYAPRTFSTVGPTAFAAAPGLGDALLAGAHDVVHEHGIWLYPSLAVLRWRRRTRRPLVIAPHGMLDRWAVRNNGWKKEIAALAFERANLRGAACLHALNRGEAAAMRSFGLTNPVAIIPNGVSLPDAAARAAAAASPPPWPSDDGRRALLFLGRLHPKKGVLETVQGWARLKQTAPKVAAGWRLVLAGWDESGQADAVRAAALGLGLVVGEDVVVAGPILGARKAAAFAHAGAFILASRSEGLPMAVLEAWAHAAPVFMTAACNLPEGFAAKAAIEIRTDPDALAQALALHLPRAELAELGRRGRALVEARFSWTRVAEDLTALYRWVRAARRSAAAVRGGVLAQMPLGRLHQFLTHHPIAGRAPWRAWASVIDWQVRSRLADEVVVGWIGGARFAARRGMTGFTGNIYAGLHEAVDMLFVLHFLRPGDLFADIGANVGSYTILASAVAGADTAAVEPDPTTAGRLRRNVSLNGIERQVTIHEVAVAASPGEARFTIGRDTVNRVANASDTETRTVSVDTIDRLFAARAPTMLKLDIEGYEAEAIKGAASILRHPALKAVALETSGGAIDDTLRRAGFAQAHYEISTRLLVEAPTAARASNQLFVRDPAEIMTRLRQAAAIEVRGLRL